MVTLIWIAAALMLFFVIAVCVLYVGLPSIMRGRSRELITKYEEIFISYGILSIENIEELREKYLPSNWKRRIVISRSLDQGFDDYLNELKFLGDMRAISLVLFGKN